ncbi:MAG: helicase-associated domain-containing protein, partial [Deltaproteobacteria bacterium]
MSKVHANPDKYAVMRYLNNHYPPIELEKLLDYPSPHERENAFLKITDISWLENFLIAKDYHAWEELHGTDSIPYPLIASQEIFTTLKRIIRLLMTCPEAIPFSSLPRGEKAADDEVLADAIGACIRYALLFPELRPADLIPVIGIWPAISQHLHRPKPQAPQPGEVTECFFLPFLMEDITSLLVTCSGNPLRYRAQGDMLFSRDADALASSLVSLPPWVLAATNWDPPARVDMAAYWLSALGLVETDGLPGTKRQMVTTASGQQWLTFSPKERLKMVLNAGKKRMGLKGGFLAEVEGTRALDPLVEFFRDGVEHRRKPIIMALRRIFEPLSGGAMLPLQDFTAYHAHETNPLIRSLDPQEPILKIRSWSTWSTPPPDDDQKEDLWAKALYRWVLYCLLPQGAVQLGMYGPNHSICFSLTEIGRYFLGFVEDFDFGAAEEGNVIVQPNFDVVFLAPSPLIEAEIAPFAERRGAKMGLLFQITKSSIFKAAALGLTSTRVLETLNRVSSKEIPANVVREIEGWYGQCRRVA